MNKIAVQIVGRSSEDKHYFPEKKMFKFENLKIYSYRVWCLY